MNFILFIHLLQNMLNYIKNYLTKYGFYYFTVSVFFGMLLEVMLFFHTDKMNLYDESEDDGFKLTKMLRDKLANRMKKHNERK